MSLRIFRCAASRFMLSHFLSIPLYFGGGYTKYMTGIRDILGQQGITQERLICTGTIVPCPCRNTNKIRLTIRQDVAPCKHELSSSTRHVLK